MDIDRIKQACTETLVIGLLKEAPLHGYAMCQEIESRSGGYFTLKYSTLYPLLHKLEKRGLLESHWAELDSGKPRKVYRLTSKGSKFYDRSIERWRELVAAMAELIPEVAE